MSSEFMRRTADALEKLAEHLDTQEHLRQQSATQERHRVAQALGEKYAHATGEDLPADVLTKIAESDADIISVFEKLAGRTGVEEAPDEMGGAHDPTDGNTAHASSRRELVKEAEQAADSRLIDWIMS